MPSYRAGNLEAALRRKLDDSGEPGVVFVAGENDGFGGLCGLSVLLRRGRPMGVRFRRFVSGRRGCVVRLGWADCLPSSFDGWIGLRVSGQLCNGFKVVHEVRIAGKDSHSNVRSTVGVLLRGRG